MRFFRKGRRAGIDVFFIGNVALPQKFVLGTPLVLLLLFMFTCMSGDLAFGWKGQGALIFSTVMGIVLGVVVAAGLLSLVVVGIVHGVRVIRKVNSVRSDYDYN